jgi:enoyl-CoA hydratase/carnithine racemase
MAEDRWSTVRADEQGWLGLLTLDRPERLNALTPTLIREFGEASRFLAAAGAKVIVITGSERAFCVGADLSEVATIGRTEQFYAWTTAIQEEFAALESLSAVTIAAIDGFCMGGGLELAMRCDYRLAAETARIALPEIKHGLLPTGGGLTVLVELVGLAQAKDLVLSGRTLSAAEARSVGLVHDVVGSPAAGPAVAWAEQFRDHPRLALRAAKQAFRLTRTGTPPGWSDVMEALTACLLVSGDEAKEGIAAFLEKREARFA